MDCEFMMSGSHDLFKSTSLSASADMDFCFYDDCEDVTSPSALSADVWKKFELLPTPPRSPERDSGLVPDDEGCQLFGGAANLGSSLVTSGDIFDVDEDSIGDVIEHLSADEKALSDSIDEALSIMKESEAAADVLLRDFMWSAPGLEALGFVPSVVTKPYYDADPLVGAPPTPNASSSTSSSASVATAASYCDPSQVFDCVGVTRHLGNELSDADDSDNEDADELTADVEEEDIDEASSGACETGDSGSAGDAEESEDEDDDDEEIDVVSVQKHHTKVKVEPQTVYCAPPVRRCTLQQPQQQSLKSHHQRHHGNSLLSSSHHSSVYVKREYDDIPDEVASITSHVAAMHNYFNPSAAACSQSAPQSPTADYQQSRRDAYKRVRSYESYPPSPNSLLAKKPRMGVSDLRTAAGALCRYKTSTSSSSMGRYHHYGNMGRGSSAAARYPGNKQREMHNVLERKRRDDLRWNFMSLRNLLPSMSASRDRMPKVVILRKSREYIRALKISFQKLSEELANQEARNKELRRRLQDLRDDQCLEL